MKERSRHLVKALGALTLVVAGMIYIGFFDRDKIVITTLATTGPDYAVVMGHFKLKLQMPDSVPTDVSGIMIAAGSSEGLGDYLNDNYRAFGDYFILKGKVVGVRQSDSHSYHPLIEIQGWEHINKEVFWLLIFLWIFFLIIFIRSTRRYLKARSNAST